MNLKYWEWEDAPFKEKVRRPSIAEITRVFFNNETQAYRFAMALSLVKKMGRVRLKDCPKTLPAATWKRYLDFGVRVGLLKHEEEAYSFTSRFARSMKNFAAYIKAWMERGSDEDLEILFARAKKERQVKRGGRKKELFE